MPGIHTADDFDAIGQWIAGARRYYIQPFRSVKVLDQCSVDGAAKATLDYDCCAANVRKYVKDVTVRQV